MNAMKGFVACICNCCFTCNLFLDKARKYKYTKYMILEISFIWEIHEACYEKTFRWNLTNTQFQSIDAGKS